MEDETWDGYGLWNTMGLKWAEVGTDAFIGAELLWRGKGEEGNVLYNGLGGTLNYLIRPVQNNKTSPNAPTMCKRTPISHPNEAASMMMVRTTAKIKSKQHILPLAFFWYRFADRSSMSACRVSVFVFCTLTSMVSSCAPCS